MTIRLTLCERDTTDRETDGRHARYANIACHAKNHDAVVYRTVTVALAAA